VEGVGPLHRQPSRDDAQDTSRANFSIQSATHYLSAARTER
jgi:hypothetical protein